MRMGEKRRRDYSDVLAVSVARDFPARQAPTQPERTQQRANSAKTTKRLRIIELGERCDYREYSRFFVNKAVELVEAHDSGGTSGWYKFVFDDDRAALNKAAGWSDAKQKYLLTRPKFKQ